MWIVTKIGWNAFKLLTFDLSNNINFWKSHCVSVSLCDINMKGNKVTKAANTVGNIAFIVAKLFNIIIYFDICMFLWPGRGFWDCFQENVTVWHAT